MPAGICNVYTRARGTALAAQVLSLPVSPGRGPYGSAEMGGGKPTILSIDRARDGASGALEGTIALLGAYVGNTDSTSAAAAQRFIATGSSNLFDTDGVNLTFATVVPATLNWLVRIGGPQGTWALYAAAPASQTQYGITNPSGNVARVTIGGANLVAGTIVELFKVAPTTLLAAGANETVRQEVLNTPDVVWCSEVPAATNQSLTVVTMEPEF